jgi:hypothetical protein
VDVILNAVLATPDDANDRPDAPAPPAPTVIVVVLIPNAVEPVRKPPAPPPPDGSPPPPDDPPPPATIRYSRFKENACVYPLDQPDPNQTFILLVSVSKITIPKYGFVGREVEVQIPGLMPRVVAVTVMTMTALKTIQSQAKLSIGWYLFQKSSVQHRVIVGVYC